MKLEHAIEFLMYSYFKLRLEDGKDPEKVLNASINRAYLDATQQGAYNTLIPKGDKGGLSENAKEKGYDKLKGAIQELLEKDWEFEKWHEDICKKLCGEVYREVCYAYGKDTFSYGNAQKWVNMSLKYLCILYQIYKKYYPACGFCKNYGKKIEKYEEDFHVPVDSYIINKGKEYGIAQDISWSKWEKEDYTPFQDSLRASVSLEEGETLLEWEHKAWIEQKEK